MKISAHANVTNPEKMGFPYLESIKSYANICDEVIIVDGGSTDGSLEKMAKIPKVRIVKGLKWDYNFDWTILPKNLQIGDEECKGQWAFKFDMDYIFHEKFAKQLIKEMAKTDLPAIEMAKCNFTKVDTHFVKN